MTKEEDDYDHFLSPFEMRVRYIRATLPCYTKMGYLSLNRLEEHDWHLKP